MRYLFFIISFFLLSSHLYAAPEECYYLEISFELDNQHFKGYLQLMPPEPITSKQKIEFKEQKKFEAYFNSQTAGSDTLTIYTQLVNFTYVAQNESDTIRATFGVAETKLLLPNAKLKKPTFHSVKKCGVGDSILSPVTGADQHWLSQPIKRREAFGLDNTTCDYEVFYLQKENAISIQLVKELKKAMQADNYPLTQKLLKQLRQQHVIVLAACSC